MMNNIDLDSYIQLISKLSKILEDVSIKQSEPRVVADLLKGLSGLNVKSSDGWFDISTSGVFVHANPFVSSTHFPCKQPSSVEVGDLLLIVTIINGNQEEHRAMLLQAKKTSKILTTPGNDNQWFLYQQWPKFRYKSRSGSLYGKTRYIKEPDMYDAAKYLLIHNTPVSFPYCDNRIWCSCLLIEGFCCNFKGRNYLTAHPTKDHLSRYRSFLDELVHFILGNAGKSFEFPSPEEDEGWNKFIEDLITITAEKVSKFVQNAPGSSHKTRGILNQKFRYGKDMTFLNLSTQGNGEPPNNTRNLGDDADNEGGLSIVEFVVSFNPDRIMR